MNGLAYHKLAFPDFCKKKEKKCVEQEMKDKFQFSVFQVENPNQKSLLWKRENIYTSTNIFVWQAVVKVVPHLCYLGIEQAFIAIW